MERLTLWELGLKVLIREIEKSNRNKVAEQLGLDASTVWRWVEGERGGKRPNAQYLDLIFQTFGDSFEEVLMESYDQETAQMLIELRKMGRLEIAKKALRILSAEDPHTEKFIQDISFYDKHLK